MAVIHDPDQARARMIVEQLEARGCRDADVLRAMRGVPRHLFVDPGMRERAYDDTPLPIGERQTISQPYMVALMTEALAPRPGERVLEIGTGSGYQAAILAEMGARVVSVERIPVLAERARAVLAALGYGARVTVEVADGTLGWPAGAPWDAIVVTAGAPQIPRPLLDQLAPDGRLVLPMGDDELQTLVRLRRNAGGLVEECLGECRFVKLLGSHGWEEP
ncbi:MAG TPA: protein-L-isoaspartate(D-aspartate) O-methyltransferase [Candidatus Binatia bacterium]|nr:protein-L-isoaspartate(D-aspartate) O-methyltransferase [Candidatus Binatia bacterium]